MLAEEGWNFYYSSSRITGMLEYNDAFLITIALDANAVSGSLGLDYSLFMENLTSAWFVGLFLEQLFFA